MIFFHDLAMIDCRVTLSSLTDFFLIFLPNRFEKLLKAISGIVNFVNRVGDELLLSSASSWKLTFLASCISSPSIVCPEEYFRFPESLLSKPLSDKDLSLSFLAADFLTLDCGLILEQLLEGLWNNQNKMKKYNARNCAWIQILFFFS